MTDKQEQRQLTTKELTTIAKRRHLREVRIKELEEMRNKNSKDATADKSG